MERKLYAYEKRSFFRKTLYLQSAKASLERILSKELLTTSNTFNYEIF